MATREDLIKMADAIAVAAQAIVTQAGSTTSTGVAATQIKERAGQLKAALQETTPGFESTAATELMKLGDELKQLLIASGAVAPDGSPGAAASGGGLLTLLIVGAVAFLGWQLLKG